MRDTPKALFDVLNPYVHKRKKRLSFLPKLKTKLIKAYQQVNNDRVLEIRIHESVLIAARGELNKLLSEPTIDSTKGEK